MGGVLPSGSKSKPSPTKFLVYGFLEPPHSVFLLLEGGSRDPPHSRSTLTWRRNRMEKEQHQKQNEEGKEQTEPRVATGNRLGTTPGPILAPP